MEAKTYPLIPMSEIKDEVRKIAVAWAEGNGYDWIGDKHKLASDIQNYTAQQTAYLQQELKEAEAMRRSWEDSFMLAGAKNMVLQQENERLKDEIKNHAIAFANFMLKHECHTNGFGGWGSNRDQLNANHNGTTSTDIYQLFIKHIKNG